MNTHKFPFTSRLHPGRAAALVAFACMILLGAHSRAELTEPDNIVYGTIALGGVAVPANATDVVVEARRLPGGSAVASCRIGSEPHLGNLYVLRIRLEAGFPLLDPNAFSVGSTVHIVVRNASGVLAQTTCVLAERGTAQRLDIGGALADGDADELPDAWETHYFGNLTRNATTVAANGQSAMQHFVAGTNPNDTNSAFKLSLDLAGRLTRVSFFAFGTGGPGYAGMARSYALESAPESTGPFRGVPNYTNVPGADQVVTLEAPGTNAALFYRAKVWLHTP